MPDAEAGARVPHLLAVGLLAPLVDADAERLPAVVAEVRPPLPLAVAAEEPRLKRLPVRDVLPPRQIPLRTRVRQPEARNHASRARAVGLGR